MIRVDPMTKPLRRGFRVVGAGLMAAAIGGGILTLDNDDHGAQEHHHDHEIVSDGARWSRSQPPADAAEPPVASPKRRAQPILRPASGLGRHTFWRRGGSANGVVARRAPRRPPRAAGGSDSSDGTGTRRGARRTSARTANTHRKHRAAS